MAFINVINVWIHILHRHEKHKIKQPTHSYTFGNEFVGGNDEFKEVKIALQMPCICLDASVLNRILANEHTHTQY